jgi:hypothetical protein
MEHGISLLCSKELTNGLCADTDNAVLTLTSDIFTIYFNIIFSEI